MANIIIIIELAKTKPTYSAYPVKKGNTTKFTVQKR